MVTTGKLADNLLKGENITEGVAEHSEIVLLPVELLVLKPQ